MLCELCRIKPAAKQFVLKNAGRSERLSVCCECKNREWVVRSG